MWTSKKDMIQDFLTISSSYYPITEESYKFFSKSQECSLQKQAKNLEYVDSRNGEIINEKDLLYDSTDYKNPGRGRGRIIKSYHLLEEQLQKQLRMVKPFRCSNEMIEAHYCKEKRFENFCDSGSNLTMTEEENFFKQEKNKTFKNSKNLKPLENNKIKRVKAIRNSKKQNNALMLSLGSQFQEISKNS